MFEEKFRNLVFSFVEKKEINLVDSLLLSIVTKDDKLKKLFTEEAKTSLENKIKEIEENTESIENELKNGKQKLNSVFKEILKIKKDFNDSDKISESDFLYFILESETLDYTNEILKENEKIKGFKDEYIQEKNKILDNVSSEIKRNEYSSGDAEGEIEINQNKTALLKYTSSLNEKVKTDSITGLIGRDRELRSLIRSLSRKDKNNPIILGESGVGKTALVEGLAYKIEKNEVGEALKNVEIRSLDLASLTAGTKYRGDFEERFKDLLSNLIEHDNVILFIDEIHTIISPQNSQQGTASFGNLLKPYLTKNLIKVIGATTFDEYAKHVETDPALTRRFNKVVLDKPSEEETFKILLESRVFYEKFHNVKYSESLLRKTIELSERFIPEKNFPDKAFDIMDEMGVITHEDGLVDVSFETLEIVLREKVGIKDTGSLFVNKVKTLSSNLKSTIFGQDESIDEIVDSVIVSRSGFNSKDKPDSVFLFLGASGVGKTEMAKSLSKSLDMNLIRMDMSEYNETASATKLIGSNAGYAGYEDGGVLTNAVAKNPYSVILIDEIEKAHTSIYNLFLQVFDNGFILDGKGKKIDFRHSIIIMTSNIGLNEEKASIGFSADFKKGTEYIVELEKHLPIEFINRIDSIMKFNYLDKEVAKKVVLLEIEKLNLILKEKKCCLFVDDSVVDFIVSKTYSKNYGARPIAKYIHSNISTQIAKELMLNDLVSSNIRVTMLDGELLFNF